MRRSHYTEVARYWFTFYLENLSLRDFNSRKAKENWVICHEILSMYTPLERELIRDFYLVDRGDISSVINTYSNRLRIDRSGAWKIIRDIEREYADKRGI